MKRALCFGINNYPGTENDLSECINDAKDWAARLKELGFTAEIYLDASVTIENFTRLLSREVGLATAGDWLIIQYSGHGTYGVDINGDEGDGYDEALYLYNGALYDDKIREILKYLQARVHIVFILDSCFSGTATRKPVGIPKTKIRFVQPQNLPRVLKPRKRMLADEEMVEILLSGCSDKESSYDATLLSNGAFTYYALKTLELGLNFYDWHERIRQHLPSSEYPQTPQLEGSIKNKLLYLGEDTITPVPEPEPSPEPIPSEQPHWWASGWFVVAVVIVIAIIIYLTLR